VTDAKRVQFYLSFFSAKQRKGKDEGEGGGGKRQIAHPSSATNVPFTSRFMLR
jgi:hypothetical protein